MISLTQSLWDLNVLSNAFGNMMRIPHGIYIVSILNTIPYKHAYYTYSLVGPTVLYIEIGLACLSLSLPDGGSGVVVELSKVIRQPPSPESSQGNMGATTSMWSLSRR